MTFHGACHSNTRQALEQPSKVQLPFEIDALVLFEMEDLEVQNLDINDICKMK